MLCTNPASPKGTQDWWAPTALTALVADIIGNDVDTCTIFSVYGLDDQKLSIRTTSHPSGSIAVNSIRLDSGHAGSVIDTGRICMLTSINAMRFAHRNGGRRRPPPRCGVGPPGYERPQGIPSWLAR